MKKMRKYVPGCLGMIIGLFTAFGIHFVVLKALGVNSPGLLTALLLVGVFGGATLFNMYAPEEWRDDSYRGPPGPPPMSF